MAWRISCTSELCCKSRSAIFRGHRFELLERHSRPAQTIAEACVVKPVAEAMA